MKKRILIFLLVLLLLTSSFYSVSAETYNLSSLADVQSFLIQNLKSRNSEINIKYTGKSVGLENTLNNALLYDEYLKYTIGYYKWSYSGYEGSLNIKIEANHLLSKSEEDASNTKIKEIISNLVTKDMSDHEKIKIIHDYIVINTKYDTSLTYRTHYDALFRGTTVCHGYALLFYRFMSELNIPVRLVIGRTTEPHIWNMVMVDNYWYHIDVIFNDPIPDRVDRISYDYYMLTEQQIKKDHIIEENSIPTSTLTYDLLLSNKINDSNEKFYTSLLKELGYSYTALPQSINEPTISLEYINIFSLGKYISFNDEYGYPFIDKNNRTQVPFRITLENLGAKVFWEESTRTAIASYNGNIVRIPIGESYILVNGKYQPNDTVAVIINGRTYLPIRAVVTALGFEVAWESSTRTVLIR